MLPLCVIRKKTSHGSESRSKNPPSKKKHIQSETKRLIIHDPQLIPLHGVNYGVSLDASNPAPVDMVHIL